MENVEANASAEIFSAVAAKALPMTDDSFDASFITMCGQPRTTDD